jgi:hypothetical protein
MWCLIPVVRADVQILPTGVGFSEAVRMEVRNRSQRIVFHGFEPAYPSN